MMDMRRRGKVGRLGMVGTNGKKFAAIQAHLDKNLGEVYHMDSSLDRTFPAQDKVDPDACQCLYT